MLDNTGLQQIYKDFNLLERGREIICKARSSEPSLRVRSRFGMISTRYTSNKMGHTLQAADNLSLGALYLLEHDPRVFKIWDMPPLKGFHLFWEGLPDGSKRLKGACQDLDSVLHRADCNGMRYNRFCRGAFTSH